MEMFRQIEAKAYLTLETFLEGSISEHLLKWIKPFFIETPQNFMHNGHHETMHGKYEANPLHFSCL
jgi:hypothetical protein